MLDEAAPLGTCCVINLLCIYKDFKCQGTLLLLLLLLLLRQLLLCHQTLTCAPAAAVP
jgi:hypothetical protein